jgi:endonuclease G
MRFKIRIVSLILFGFFLFVGFKSQQSELPNSLEIPAHSKQEILICHTGYCLSYDEKYKLAKWVAYELTLEETQGTIGRSDKFKPDPLLTRNSATLDDYKKSGYDRGHLAPAADMKWSLQAMQESFYLSNICPQDKSFNRGIWKKLEEQVREWAIANKSIYITTGPILEEGLPTIGSNKIPVSKAFYKVILDYRQPEIKAIGFLIPNKGSSFPISSYAIPIDSIEKITHLDFFEKLPDDIENRIEQSVCVSSWGL